MKEAYVSFETAKLLKEKGFDGEIHTTYDDEGYTQPSITQQMACAWLRGKGFEIGVFYLFKAIKPDVTVFDGYIPNVTHVIDGVYKDSWDMDVVKDYNDAVETALKYVLENLI